MNIEWMEIVKLVPDITMYRCGAPVFISDIDPLMKNSWHISKLALIKMLVIVCFF